MKGAAAAALIAAVLLLAAACSSDSSPTRPAAPTIDESPASPADVFRGLSALTMLSLTNNGLTALPKGIFDGLPSLTELDLRGNAMLDADHLAGLPSRVNLRLDDGPLKSLRLTPTPSPVAIPTP